MKAARTEDGKLFCAALDMSLDPIENLPFICDKAVKSVKSLSPEGSYKEIDFITQNGRTELELTAYPFDPVILLIETE